MVGCNKADCDVQEETRLLEGPLLYRKNDICKLRIFNFLDCMSINWNN